MSSPSNSIPTLSNTQAKDLAGRFVMIGTENYYFKNFSPDHPGQPPWRSGAEGKAYPLLGYDRSVAAYLKFFTRPTQKRFDRTAWLVGQQLHTWLPNLAAAPLLWADTRYACQAAEGMGEFAGYLARAVPGETWLELKGNFNQLADRLCEEFRWRCMRDLVVALAVLEEANIIHGDLSPNNVVIDLAARPDQPALYLIDFDAFVAPAAGVNRAITVAEGGTFGTEGYCPPDLATAAAAGDGSVAPYSDRYGRDMLLLELLLMDRGLSPDAPPAAWSREQLERRYAARHARSDPQGWQLMAHLAPARVFAMRESERPAAAELAIGLRITAEGRRPRTATEFSRVTAAVVGHRMPLFDLQPRSHAKHSTTQGGNSHWQSGLVPGQRREEPECFRTPSLWEDLEPILLPLVVLLALPAVGCAIMVLISVLLAIFGLP